MKRILTFVMVLLCLMCGCQRQYEERYQCLYRVYYDADKYMFYSPIDALTPIYEQASKSNTKGVADWANEAMQKINYPMQSDGR